MMWLAINIIGSLMSSMFLLLFFVWMFLCFFRMFVPSNAEPLFSRGMACSVQTLLSLDISMIAMDDVDSVNIFLLKATHRVHWIIPPDLELLSESRLLRLGLNQTKLMCTHVDEVVGGHVEIMVAPIPSNFFDKDEHEHMWKFIKFMLRNSIDQEWKSLNADQVS